MFAPMRETITLLRNSGQDAPSGGNIETWQEKIDRLKDKWNDTHTSIFEMREQILDLKRKEGDNIKKKMVSLKEKIGGFRQEFKRELPYHLPEIQKDIIESCQENIDS